MQTKQTLRGVKERNYIRQWLGASILALAIFALGFVLLPTLISEASATQDVSAFASWSPVSLALDPDYGSQDATSARGDVVFGSITPTSRDTNSGSYGTQRVIKKTIGITSNGTYYTVFLSTSGSDNSLALDMENTDLSIPAIGNGSTTGVWSNPVAFSASGWGFSVPGTVIPASADAVGTSASSTPPAFTNIVTGANLDKDLTKTLDSSIYNQDIWSAVPSSSTPQQIWKATSTSANGFGTYTNSNNVEVTGDIVNDHFDIYYGIMVDTDVLSGTYENEIVYTALASATSLDDVSTNLSREIYIIANGTEQTLHFDLSSSLANPTNIINKDNITIYLVPHATVATANYELTSTIKNAASTYTTCTISSNDDIEITGDGNGATLTCISPDNTPADGTGLGEFDYWLHIDGYNFDYLSHYKRNEQDTATVAYVGLQSKLTDSNNELVITEMQEMTGNVCRNTNMWGTGTGDDARIYDYLGEDDNNPLLAAGTDTVGTSSFLLTDNRDNKPYLVRRLADENCWMVQNLNLDLSTVGTITSSDSDLNTIASWTPDVASISASFYEVTDEARAKSNAWQYVPDDATAAEEDSAFDIQHASRYIGVYYNWPAAHAENDFTDSICAKNWTLPYLNGSAIKLGFSYLTNKIYQIPTSGAERRHLALPISLFRAGQYNVSTGNLGRVGYYWTADTPSYTDSTANFARVDGSSTIYWQSTSFQAGQSIRCVARN